MTSRSWILVALVGSTVACSSSPTSSSFEPIGTVSAEGGSGGTGGSEDGGATADGSSSGNAGSNTITIGDASVLKGQYSDAAAGTTYDTYVPDADVGDSVTLTITPFVVDPGDEVYMCQQFANPFNGQDEDLVEIDGQMSVGSHHFFVFNMDPSTLRNTASPLAPCPGEGLEFHPYIYLSQQPNWDVTYPESDMGYPLVGANGLMMNVHYLNTTSESIQAKATVTIHAAKPGVVTKMVGNLFLNNESMSVPANTPESDPIWISANTVPISTFDYEILQSWSHMHMYGLDFQTLLGTSTTPFYNQTNWSAPPVENHNPPIQVPSGTSITWQCQYYNPTSSTMTFGDSALTNVMCIYFGMYYPAVPSSTAGYPDIVVAAEL